MRILWLSHLIPYPPNLGVLLRSYNLLRQAVRRNEVHMVALWQRGHQSSAREAAEAAEHVSDLCAGFRYVEIPAPSSSWRWYGLVARAYFSHLPYDAVWFRSRRFAHDFDEVHDRWPFDVIHVDTIGLSPYVLDRDPPPPFVLNHHNIESDMMHKRADLESNPLKRHYFRRQTERLISLEKRACVRAGTNAVVSALDGERLRSVAGDPAVSVVENGVDVDYFRPESPPGSGEGMVFVGGMDRYSNRDGVSFFLREVWPKLAEDDSGRSITFVGRDPPPDIAEAAARDRRIRAPGFVDDVRPFIDRAAIYVCPLRTGGGTRIKVLDALAMGKPLVATPFSVEGIGLEDGVHYLSAETPSDFLRQIRALERDRELRRRLATAGRALMVRNYSWDAIGNHLQDAYELAARKGMAIGRTPSRGRASA